MFWASECFGRLNVLSVLNVVQFKTNLKQIAMAITISMTTTIAKFRLRYLRLQNGSVTTITVIEMKMRCY